MTINVAVLGAKGRMGAETVKAISSASDLKLVAQIDLEIPLKYSHLVEPKSLLISPILTQS